MEAELMPHAKAQLDDSNGCLLLSHESALEFYRNRRVTVALGKPYPILEETPRSNNSRFSARELANVLGISTPIHLSVPNRQSRINSPYVRCHIEHERVTSLQICRGLGVVSPEEALFQICTGNGTLRQTLLAYELCGSFAICRESDDGFVNDLEPLTTPQLICEHASAKVGNRRSTRFRTIRRIMASLVAGAASPAEAKLCLAIVVPRTMGGQGLPKPELNAEIPVMGYVAGLTTRYAIRPDEFWRGANLILEYMGSHHAEASRMGEDASRDNTLNAMGYKVIHATKRQVNDAMLYKGLMEHLRRELGVRKEMPSRKMLEKQESLRACLFDTHRNTW